MISPRDAMHAVRAPDPVRQPAPCAAASRPAFTLIELVVVLTIVSILASLTLAGLAGTRQRAKIDKTKSTIRKIHELIVPHYESYVRRRVSLDNMPPGTPFGPERLRRARLLAMLEMPDSWYDVAVTEVPSSTTMTGRLVAPTGANTDLAPWAWKAVPRSYYAYRQSLSLDPRYPSSECLYMIVSRGLGEPDVMEQFRADEIGDVDEDGAPEFVDGWGRPIAFMRWPIGFISPIQPAPPSPPGPGDPHDPFDPLRLEAGAFPLTPLIYSAGPDGDAENGYGLVRLNVWHTINMTQIFAATDVSPNPPLKPGEPAISAPDDYRDNITNHDLLAK